VEKIRESKMAEKEELIRIVGGDNVIDDPNILKEYSRDVSFAHPVRPNFIVKPKNAADVQAVVKWANEAGIPLVPMSSGPPHFRGDTVPGADGVVIVDLSRMKRIIRVDGRNRMAMVEPGVTFAELQPKLKKERLRLNMPMLPRSSKSVVGSMLEREPVTMPKYHWDIADPMICIEVIFGNGDKFRTGGAAGPGSLEEMWEVGGAQKVAEGPGQADWYRIIQGAQGTMGIVTWASMRCERLPTIEEPFLIGSENLESLYEFVHWLVRLRLANECLVLNNSNLAAILAKQWPREYESLRAALPPWVLFYCLAGYEYFPEERVAYQIKDMADIASRLVGVVPVRTISVVSAHDLLRTLKKPSEEPYWKLRYKGACQDVLFLTTLDMVPKFVRVMHETAEWHDYPCAEIGVYIQPCVQGACCHCEFNLFYNPTDKGEVARVQGLITNASEALIGAGAFFSRPYGIAADMAYRRDAETTAALRKLKGIFDPNNVMNPGKLCF